MCTIHGPGRGRRPRDDRRGGGQRRPRQAHRRASRRLRAFGLWVEQLVAESTGKHGTGCVPVPITVPEEGPGPPRGPVAPRGTGRPGRAVLPFRGRGGHLRARARDRSLRRTQRGRVQAKHQRGSRPSSGSRARGRKAGRGAHMAHRHVPSRRLRVPAGVRPPRPGRRARGPPPLGARPPRRCARHRRRRAPLPALHRSAPQGRPRGRDSGPDRLAHCRGPMSRCRASPTTSARSYRHRASVITAASWPTSGASCASRWTTLERSPDNS